MKCLSGFSAIVYSICQRRDVIAERGAGIILDHTSVMRVNVGMKETSAQSFRAIVPAI